MKYWFDCVVVASLPIDDVYCQSEKCLLCSVASRINSHSQFDNFPILFSLCDRQSELELICVFVFDASALLSRKKSRWKRRKRTTSIWISLIIIISDWIVDAVWCETRVQLKTMPSIWCTIHKQNGVAVIIVVGAAAAAAATNFNYCIAKCS